MFTQNDCVDLRLCYTRKQTNYVYIIHVSQLCKYYTKKCKRPNSVYFPIRNKLIVWVSLYYWSIYMNFTESHTCTCFVIDIPRNSYPIRIREAGNYN